MVNTIISYDIYVDDGASRKDILDLKEANARHEIVEKYLSKEITYKKALSLLGCSKSTLYRLISKFDASHGPCALLRDPRGRKNGQYYLSGEVENIISETIVKKLKGRASSFSQIWREVRDECIKKNLASPSLGTVASRIKSISPKNIHRLKYGAQAAYDKYGVKTGQLSTSRPLEVTQIDHTLVDVIICDDVSREPLGRPWLSVLIDIKTRVILSYYLAWHHPSMVSVASIMAFAVADKSDYLKAIDCEDVRYPFSGKPRAVHADNAKEFRSANMVKACEKNSIKLKWRPYGRKHYGGHVERLIGRLMTTAVHFLPGSTFSNNVQRKGYDSESKSAMTFLEFSQWFAREVAIYHSTVHAGIKKTPGDAWFEFFDEVSTVGMTAKQCEDFKIDFLPREKRVIGVKGVLFKCNYYYSPELLPHIGKTIYLKYNPFSIKKIWVELNKQYVDVPFSDITKDDSILEDERILRLSNGAGNRKIWMEDAERISIKNKAEKVVRQAQKDTRKARRKQATLKAHGDDDSAAVDLLKKGMISQSTESEIDYSARPQPFSSED